MTLSDWLQKTNMTQAAFAKLIGSDQGHVSDLVHRKVQPKFSSMALISTVTKGAVTFTDWADLIEASVKKAPKRAIKAIRKAER